MADGYTKLDSNIVSSSIWSEDSDTRVVWITLLAMSDFEGNVKSSIPGLARIANVTVEACEKALAKFLAPDPYSRSKESEGRRIKEIDGGWFVLNRILYREKVYSRAEYYRQYRASLRNSCATPAQQNATQTETETETETKKEKERSHFVPPSPLEVSEYSKTIGYGIDSQQFCDFYAAKGWMIGKNRMKDWRAAVRTWRRRDDKMGKPPPEPPKEKYQMARCCEPGCDRRGDRKVGEVWYCYPHAKGKEAPPPSPVQALVAQVARSLGSGPGPPGVGLTGKTVQQQKQALRVK